MKSDIEIAKEVIDGKWGAGKERERKLKNAGYDYNTIQSYVNRMIETGLPIQEVKVNAKECSGIVIYVEV